MSIRTAIKHNSRAVPTHENSNSPDDSYALGKPFTANVGDWWRWPIHLSLGSSHLFSRSFDLQKFINLLMRFPFFLAFSAFSRSADSSGRSRLFSLWEEPGINLFRLAKLARFHACCGFELVPAGGAENEFERCSAEDRVAAPLENRGALPVDTLSQREGTSSVEDRRPGSGLRSATWRLKRG
jgi:hypothetical protein